MKTVKRRCRETFDIVSGDDRLTFYKGKEYVTTPDDANGNCVVFSNFWAYNVPVSNFYDPVPFTGGSPGPEEKIKRLAELVKFAYHEGWREGEECELESDSFIYREFEDSKAKAMLEEILL